MLEQFREREREREREKVMLFMCNLKNFLFLLKL